MRHSRNQTPAYVIWVEARPSFNGKGKEAYYRAVKEAAKAQIETPIDASDIEIEITYSTGIPPAERMDVDNIQKPTLDALKDVVYRDDRQVRHTESTLFDRTKTTRVEGLVEHLQRLFYTPHEHVVRINLYSDSRLEELGGAQVLQEKRIEEFEENFDRTVRQGVSGLLCVRPF